MGAGKTNKQVLLTAEPSIQSLLVYLNATLFFFFQKLFLKLSVHTHTHIKVINQSAGINPLLPDT